MMQRQQMLQAPSGALLATPHQQMMQTVRVVQQAPLATGDTYKHQQVSFRPPSNDYLQQQQQQQVHSAPARPQVENYLFNELSESESLATFGPDSEQTSDDTSEIEPTISFSSGPGSGLSAYDETLLFSEFIDLQDVPLNVDESDWLKKFLPPCSSMG